MRRKYQVLGDHCKGLARPYESILRTHINFGFELGKSEQSAVLRSHAATFNFSFDRFGGTPREAIGYYRGLAEAGVQYFIVSIRGDDPNILQALAEQVVPEIVSV